MKKIIILLSIILSLNFISCSDYLDVKPKAEIKLDVMFESEQGFKDALVGCYIMLSDESLYGAELTCTFLDVLGQQYYMPGNTSNPYEKSSKYIYTDQNAENIIENIWSKMYKVIANINAIIEGLENNKNILHPSIYAMIKAECYSLRAFIYTDLVRLFTWGDITTRTEKLEEYSIPYAKVYDKNIIPQYKLKDVLKYIHEDLEIALEIFDSYDPLSKSGNRPENYDLPNNDKFYDRENVSYRMNLPAALAVRMRLNMWEGNYEQAYEDAIFLTDNNFSVSWSTLLDVDENQRDLTFSNEMLFGVQTHERFENVVKPYFKLLAKDNLNSNGSALCLTKTRVESIYEINEGIGASDWRYVRLWDKSANNYEFLKFWEFEDMRFRNNMPLIKWPEIYYTLVECSLRKGDKYSAIENLNNVRNHRNIPSNLNISHTLSIDEVWEELYKEWKKEYIGDGQMFYYYKRNAYTSIPYGPSLEYDDNVYVLPLPQLEIDFGGRTPLVTNEEN